MSDDAFPPTYKELARDLARLRAACRALAGLAPKAFDRVTPEALRMVATARGWTKRTRWEMGKGRGRFVFEAWGAPEQRRSPRLAKADIPVVAPSRTGRRSAIENFLGMVAERHNLAPAELLAEVLAAVDASKGTP